MSMSNQSSRIGFIGTKEISDGIKATGHIEWGFDPVAGFNWVGIQNRLGYIRFDVHGHQFTFGQQDGAWKKVVDWTDMYEVYGADSHNTSETYGTGKAPAIQYSTSFGILDLTANAQVKNNDNEWSSGAALVLNLMEDALNLGFTAQYVSEVMGSENDPLMLAAGFNWISEFGLSAALTASYQMETLMGDGFGFESFLGYTFGDIGHELYLGNNYQTMESVSTVNYFDFGGRLKLLPGSSLYAFAEAKYDLDADENAMDFFVGARYSF